MPQYLDDNGNPISAPQKTYLDPNTGEPLKAPANPTPFVDMSHVAGAGSAGVPQIAAHPDSPEMQSSLLAPSTYGKAISDTASGLIAPLAHIPSQIASYGGFKNPSDQGGPIQSIVNNPDKGAGVANALAQVGTGIVIGKAAEAAAPAISSATKLASRFPGALAESKAAFAKATYPKNMSLTPEETTAQSVVKALAPDAAAIPNVKSASPEIPDALAYAQREGIPQNGKLDTAKALQGRADEIQAHYDNNILKPNKTAVQTVPANYDGSTVGENRATLGQINDRVDVINRELKSNFRKKLSSQTTEANASDADLLSEKAHLTKILHDKLGELTGIAPEDIAGMRQRAGKLRSLAQEVTDSANKDTLAAGKREVSGGTFSLRNPIDGLQDKIGGGQEVIGNRAWNEALGKIQPAEKPLPNPNAPGPNVATTPQAAQAEFLKAQELEQSAQVASAGRSSQASTARLSNRSAINSDLWSSQGYAKVVNHLDIDPTSGITRGELVKFGLTPGGKSMLVRASGLTPGSPAMRTLVQQIKLGLTK